MSDSSAFPQPAPRLRASGSSEVDVSTDETSQAKETAVRRATAPPKPKRVRRRGRPPGTKLKKPPRRPEEDLPGEDYLHRMEELGAREGESYLSFVGRLGRMQTQREALLKAARATDGNLIDTCRRLGISRHNLRMHLKAVGLSTDMLRAFRPEAIHLRQIGAANAALEGTVQ